MLAAGAASSSQLARACLEISSNLQSYTVDCASIDPLLSELNGSWMGPTACHVTQRLLPLLSQLQHHEPCQRNL